MHKVKANYLIEQLSPWNADKHSQSQVATMVEQLWTCLNTIGVRTLKGGPLADPGGRTQRAPPPNSRGPMIFLMPKTLIFLIFSSLASLAINLKHDFNRNTAQTR